MLKFGLLALAILAGSCRRNFLCLVLSSSSQPFPQVTIFLLHNLIVYSSPVVKLLSRNPRYQCRSDSLGAPSLQFGLWL